MEGATARAAATRVSRLRCDGAWCRSLDDSSIAAIGQQDRKTSAPGALLQHRLELSLSAAASRLLRGHACRCAPATASCAAGGLHLRVARAAGVGARRCCPPATRPWRCLVLGDGRVGPGCVRSRGPGVSGACHVRLLVNCGEVPLRRSPEKTPETHDGRSRSPWRGAQPEIPHPLSDADLLLGVPQAADSRR